MRVRPNGAPLEEVDCFKYLASPVVADGGCEKNVVHRMNGEYRTWGTLKSVLGIRGFGQIQRSVCIKEYVIVLSRGRGYEK